MFLEYWNRQKGLSNIWQRLSCLLDEWIAKMCKKIFFMMALFLKSNLSILRCTWTGGINLKILLGYNINCLRIWPFMRHPLFPTIKASKLIFICFQFQLLSTMQGLNNWSWKLKNISFLHIFAIHSSSRHKKRALKGLTRTWQGPDKGLKRDWKGTEKGLKRDLTGTFRTFSLWNVKSLMNTL